MRCSENIVINRLKSERVQLINRVLTKQTVLMIKKTFLLVIFCTIFFSGGKIYSQFYIGAGPNALIPVNKFDEYCRDSYGLNAILESRIYCNLWYGVRMDYVSFDNRGDSLGLEFDDAVLISPQIRYNFLIEDCYNDKTIPYIQGMLTISSIGANDNESRLGIGAAAGLGVTLGFDFWDKCWLLDLSGLWSVPNSIYRDSGRFSIQSILLSLTLSMSL